MAFNWDEQIQQVANEFNRKRMMPTPGLGLANGGAIPQLGYANAGIIPGQPDPTVADDITINAKKGEFILPDWYVAAKGTDSIEKDVAKVAQAKGIEWAPGPKMHNEPDAMGRMDKPGLPMGMPGGADGLFGDDSLMRRFRDDQIAGMQPPTPTPVPDSISLDSNMDAVTGRTSEGRFRLPNPFPTQEGIQARLDANLAKRDAGLVAKTEVAPAATAAVPAVTRPATNMTTDQMLDTPNAQGVTARQQSVGLPISNRPSESDRVQMGIDADASRLAARTASEAGYAKSAAELDANAEKLQQRDKSAAIGLNLKNIQNSIANEASNAAYLATLGPEGTGKDNLAASKIRMAALNEQLGIATGQYKLDEDAGTKREGLKMGLTERQIADLTERRKQDIGLEGEKIKATEGQKGRDQVAALNAEGRRDAAGLAADARRDAAAIAAEASKQKSKATLMASPAFTALEEQQQEEVLQRFEMDPETHDWKPGQKAQEEVSNWIFGRDKNQPKKEYKPGMAVAKQKASLAPDKLASQYYSPAEIAAYKKSKGLI